MGERGEAVAAGAKVLIVLTSNTRRGAETQGHQLAQQLVGAGLAAEVVALAGRPGEGRLPVDYLGDAALSPRTLLALRRRARGRAVVIGYGSKTLPACALALLGRRVPFVYRSIGNPADWSRGGVHRFRTRLLYRRVHRVAALWPAAGESITKLYGVPAERVSVIPNARPDVVGRREPSVANRSVGFVGLSPEKQPLVAVSAIAALEGVTMVIAGDGAMKTEVLEACERQLAGRYEYLGVIDDMDQLWRRVDVLLMTSSTEGMPGVVIEAGLRGIPTVAPDVGAMAALVEDGVTGRVIRAGSRLSDYGAALDEVLQVSTALGEAAELRMRSRFVWPVVVDQWLVLLGAVEAERAR